MIRVHSLKKKEKKEKKKKEKRRKKKERKKKGVMTYLWIVSSFIGCLYRVLWVVC